MISISQCRSFFRAAALALLVAASHTAWGQTKSAVAVNLEAKKVVTAADGKESLESAAKAKPGDFIQYEAAYRNTSGDAVKNVQATVPVPDGLAFAADSAKPAGALASTDGKNFEPMPLMRTVKKADGTTEKQPVSLSEYRALRWTISELPAGASKTVSLRAKVLTNSAAK